MIALIVLVAVVALLVMGALSFNDHCQRRFGVEIFVIGRMLLNLAGWALVAAGCCFGAGVLVTVLGGAILLAQLVRLSVRTSVLHGFIAFALISVCTLGVLVVIVLAVAALCENKGRHSVIIID